MVWNHHEFGFIVVDMTILCTNVELTVIIIL